MSEKLPEPITGRDPGDENDYRPPPDEFDRSDEAAEQSQWEFDQQTRDTAPERDDA